MYKILSIIFLTSILACSNSAKNNDETLSNSTQEVSQFIDIWIYKDAIFKVNGQKITESALVNRIQALSIKKGDFVRILIDENAWFGSIVKLQSLMIKNNIGASSISIRILNSEKMSKIGKDILLIHVQEDENIYFNGNLIHLKDLDIALNSYNKDNSSIWLSANDEAIVGDVFDTQKNIISKGFKITYM